MVRTKKRAVFFEGGTILNKTGAVFLKVGLF